MKSLYQTELDIEEANKRMECPIRAPIVAFVAVYITLHAPSADLDKDNVESDCNCHGSECPMWLTDGANSGCGLARQRER